MILKYEGGRGGRPTSNISKLIKQHVQYNRNLKGNQWGLGLVKGVSPHIVAL